MEKIVGDFLIEINSKQTIEGECDNINLTTEGKYFYRNGEYCISYTEYDDDDPSIFTNNMVKVSTKRNTITVLRNNQTCKNASRMILELNTRHNCYYETPLGCLMIGIYTNTINFTLDNNGGVAHASYTLDCNDMLMSENEITLKIKRKGV